MVFVYVETPQYLSTIESIHSDIGLFFWTPAFRFPYTGVLTTT